MPDIVAGTTFIQVTNTVPQPHLWIIVTDPDPVTLKVIGVALVTSRSYTDKTVGVDPVS